MTAADILWLATRKGSNFTYSQALAYPAWHLVYFDAGIEDTAVFTLHCLHKTKQLNAQLFSTESPSYFGLKSVSVVPAEEAIARKTGHFESGCWDRLLNCISWLGECTTPKSAKTPPNVFNLPPPSQAQTIQSGRLSTCSTSAASPPLKSPQNCHPELFLLLKMWEKGREKKRGGNVWEWSVWQTRAINTFGRAELFMDKGKLLNGSMRHFLCKFV